MLWTGFLPRKDKVKKGQSMEVKNVEQTQTQDFSKASESLSCALAVFSEIIEQKISIPLKRELEAIKEDEFNYRENMKGQWIGLNHEFNEFSKKNLEYEKNMLENQAVLDKKLNDIQELFNSAKLQIEKEIDSAKQQITKEVDSFKEKMKKASESITKIINE